MDSFPTFNHPALTPVLPLCKTAAKCSMGLAGCPPALTVLYNPFILLAMLWKPFNRPATDGFRPDRLLPTRLPKTGRCRGNMFHPREKRTGHGARKRWMVSEKSRSHAQPQRPERERSHMTGSFLGVLGCLCEQTQSLRVRRRFIPPYAGPWGPRRQGGRSFPPPRA